MRNCWKKFEAKNIGFGNLVKFWIWKKRKLKIIWFENSKKIEIGKEFKVENIYKNWKLLQILKKHLTNFENFLKIVYCKFWKNVSVKFEN